MRSRADLIHELVEDLRPVRPVLSPGRLATVWLAGSWFFVLAATLATGPMRPGFEAQLAEEPRFLGEVLLGLLAGAAAIHAAGRLGVPDPASLLRQAGLALLLLGAWGGAYVYGVLDSALEPSMLGKRESCFFETLLYAGPPLAAGLWLVRRAAPLGRVRTGALVGVAAAALPALLMQLACVYDPAHNLSHHLAPVAAMGALGALLGPVALRRL